MFTKDELELINTALTEYYLKHIKEYDTQKAKRRKNCDWHLSVMKKTSDLQSKIYILKNSM